MSVFRNAPADPMHNGYARIPDPAELEPDRDVCEHGEYYRDCDTCASAHTVDAYDEGCLDD